MTTFQPGEEVKFSARFLRSICPSAARGWPTTLDPGTGTIVGTVDLGGGWVLHDVWFPDTLRRVNAANLVSARPRAVYNEAMRAEHTPRGYPEPGR